MSGRSYPGSRRNGTWKGRTTTVIVGGEPWAVPRGFGATYMRVAKSWTKSAAQSCQLLSDILSLVGYEVSATAVAAWPLRRRIEAEVWAISVHSRASDNLIAVPPRPEWMPDPWKGPERGQGVFASNPTVLT